MSHFEIIPLMQGTEEWLQFRKNGIGASEASSAVGESKFRTKYQLWQEKWGLKEPDKDNEAMKWGRDHEHEARCCFMEIAGISVTPEVVKSTRYPFMFASMDGLSVDCKTAVEIKCPHGTNSHEIALKKQIPDYHIPQLMHQMAVLDLDRIFYFSWRPESNSLITLYRDDGVEKLVAQEEVFWQNVQNFQPPELTDRDYVDIRDVEWVKKVQEWKYKKQKIKELEEEEKELRAYIIKPAKDNSVKGAGIKITRYPVRGRIDMDKVKEELLPNVDLEPYRKESTIQWRIS